MGIRSQKLINDCSSKRLKAVCYFIPAYPSLLHTFQNQQPALQSRFHGRGIVKNLDVDHSHSRHNKTLQVQIYMHGQWDGTFV